MENFRKSLRLPDHNYAGRNVYYVTSCVKDRVCYFGRIDMKDQPYMILNQYGRIAESQWFWLAEQFRYIRLHGFVIMPNHIHVVLEIRPSAIDAENRKIKPLSEIIGAYKTTVSKQIHMAGLNGFSWQRSFYDQVINDDKVLDSILSYIKSNPSNWRKDKFYSERSLMD